MAAHEDDAALVQHSLIVLRNFAVNDRQCVLLNAGAVDAAIAAMRRHVDVEPVQRYAVWLFCGMSFFEAAQESLQVHPVPLCVCCGSRFASECTFSCTGVIAG